MKDFLSLTNDVSQVPVMAGWIDTVGEKLQLPPDKVFNINLALEEAVVNVMNYAYPGQTGREIKLTAESEGGRLFFIIEDEGVPFDPLAKEDPDISLDADDRPIGGLGIFLVKELMSNVTYEYKDGRNVLTIEV